MNSYDVSLVTTAAEFEQVLRGLKADLPANYVVLRVSTGRGQFNDVNQAHSLRQLIETDGRIARAPTTGELEAVEAGLEKLGIPQAAYGRLSPREETPNSSAAG